MLGKQNKAMADQLATVSKRRLQKKIARLPTSEMTGGERAMRLQLGL